jgi:hypothetical protein
MTKSTADRQRRLADALRENLRRRKAPGRASDHPEAGQNPAQNEGGHDTDTRPNPANKPV